MGVLGTLWGALGVLLGALGALLGCFGIALGALGLLLGALGKLWGCSWWLLGRAWLAQCGPNDCPNDAVGKNKIRFAYRRPCLDAACFVRSGSSLHSNFIMPECQVKMPTQVEMFFQNARYVLGAYSRPAIESAASAKKPKLGLSGTQRASEPIGKCACHRRVFVVFAAGWQIQKCAGGLSQKSYGVSSVCKETQA